MTENTIPLNPPQRERQRALNPWAPVRSAISFAGLVITRVIDLDMHAASGKIADRHFDYGRPLVHCDAPRIQYFLLPFLVWCELI
jgi:hypothetical protein